MKPIIDLKKPAVIVPLSQAAVEKLYKEDLNNLECTYFSFSRKLLYEIIATGFFDHLNARYGLLISDYEREDITEASKLKTILNEDIKKFQTLKHEGFWHKFEACLIKSIEMETGLFFFF